MAKKASGNILHFNAIRFRVIGSGALQLDLHSLDAIESEALADLTLSLATNREPTQLANFTQQRAQLELKVTEYDEWFRISKITFFIKPVSTSFPG